MGFYNSRVDGVGSGREAARAMATEMAGGLTVQERAQIAARYEVWNSVAALQRWWLTVKGRMPQSVRRHQELSFEASGHRFGYGHMEKVPSIHIPI